MINVVDVNTVVAVNGSSKPYAFATRRRQGYVWRVYRKVGLASKPVATVTAHQPEVEQRKLVCHILKGISP